MKLYDFKMAPNPRRVRIFLAEKGVSYEKAGIEVVNVDMSKGETFTKEFREISPYGGLPVLELDDGERISESIAISRYFEELYPENPLMGTDAKSKALIEMWNRRMELGLYNSIALSFRHGNPMWKAVTTQVADFSEVSAIDADKQIHKLNKRLAESEFVAGDTFSVADITALCAIDFAKVIKRRIDEEKHPHLARWYQLVYERPSSKA
ncbi:MAG: glutathione S-transferase family protein [Oleispira sp.]